MCSIILILSGVFLIINGLVLFLITNFNFGLVITIALGVALVLYGTFFRRIMLIKSLARVNYAIWAGAFVLLIFIAFVAVYGKINTVTYTEDAIIVLGAGIRGEVVTLPLKHRLDKAVEFISKNPNAVVVVSGGQGPQEHITEALAMERYLVRKGVAKEKILKEEKATSTYENFVYSKEILDDYFSGEYSVAFVTNNFHIYRSSRLAEIAGLNATHLGAKIEWYSVAINYLREVAAIAKLWVLKK